ncbi:MAG TPA: ChbG/HpnK family deacetylase, partial [Burkholderiales bacterium]|nr:ChbG/HpnK family deacetylase [Burkholderiales bacterium]
MRDLRFVINADDFGMDEDTCSQTIRCLEEGAVTSASIMPTMPQTTRACEYARAHGDLAFGVHLTFVRDTVEDHAAPAARIASLIDDRGRLMNSN